jgi:hypothetical protein
LQDNKADRMAGYDKGAPIGIFVADANSSPDNHFCRLVDASATLNQLATGIWSRYKRFHKLELRLPG